MFYKKMMSVILALLLILPISEICEINTIKATVFHAMGCNLEDDQIDSNIITSNNIMAESVSSVYSNLPPRFDITTDQTTSCFFPSTGNQHNINSCVGWATTYYQFTYEVNRLRNTAKSSGNYICYSPTVTYNYINCGKNIGTNLSDAYRVLEHQGGFPLRDNDYAQDVDSYSFEWPTNESEMIKALKYRGTVNEIYLGNNINNNNLYLYRVKSLISQGHVAVVSVYYPGLSIFPQNGNMVCIRAGDRLSSDTSDAGHALTVVGYDDDFTINTSSATFTGAFKLVNSWGSGAQNNEYIWIAYDALNATSSLTGWETNYTRTRIPAFSNSNKFNFLDVREYEEVIAGIVSFNSNDVWRLGLNNTTSYDYPVWCNSVHPNISYSPLNNAVPYKIAYNYLSIDEITNANNYLNNTLYMTLHGVLGEITNNINTKLVDNYGHEIASVRNGSFGSGLSCTQSIRLRLKKGRISSYDASPITDSDYDLVSQYLLNDCELSNLQKLLADYNNDGEVDIMDLVLIMMQISANNNSTFYLDDYIEQWGCSLADIIEERFELDVHGYSGEAFIHSNYRGMIS